MRALGGYAIWCERTGRLFWSDDGAMVLRAWSPSSGERRDWRLPEPLGCFALTASRERLLLALASRLAFLDLAGGALAPIVGIDTCPSDGRCDRQGRFIFGTAAKDGASGGYWRLNHDLALERLPLGDATLAGGICFSPNGRTLYYADAGQGTLRCCDYHPCSGEIGRPRGFADVDVQGGAVVDAAGCLWGLDSAAGQLRCIGPDGGIVPLPALAAPPGAGLAFGAADLGTLFVTAGKQAVAYLPGVRGLAEQPFMGRLPSRA